MNNVKRIKGSLTATSGAVDNATATASITAPTLGQRIFITGVNASFSAAATKALQIKDGTTVIWTVNVVNAFSEDFTSPIEITTNKAASGVLAASGTGGVTGVVNLKYYIG